MRPFLVLLLLLPLAGCKDFIPDAWKTEADSTAADTIAYAPSVATADARGAFRALTPEQLERARLDRGWSRGLERAPADTAAVARNPERADSISAAAANRARGYLPLGRGAEGPSVLRVQVLLDRAGYSPGVVDGRWGQNTEKAVYWLQRTHGLPPTGVVDQRTMERLRALGGSETVVARYRVTEADVRAGYQPVPEDVYARAERDSLGFTSFAEALGERVHATPELLARLNPDADLSALRPGRQLWIPNTGRQQGATAVARVVVSDAGGYLLGYSAADDLVFYAPATLGADYDPSPSGRFEVTAVARRPEWHYQPSILADVPDGEAEATLPPGPNNPVGLVWMALSEPHYGIHGTNEPASIGHTASAGCVRLTNWDALALADRIEVGAPVRFIADGDPATLQAGAPADSLTASSAAAPATGTD